MRRSNEPRIHGPYQHGQQWRVHIVTSKPGGGRQTLYRSYPTRSEADDWIRGAQQQAQGTTVRHAIDALLATMRTAGLADGTITTAEYRLAHFFEQPQNDTRPLRWLTNRGEQLYAAAQVGRSATTHQAELALAKQIGALCVKRKWLKVDPFANVDPVGRKVHGATKPRLGTDESRKLRDHLLALGPDNPPAIITLAYLLLGKRASELVRADVRDLDDGCRVLRIRRAKTAKGIRSTVLPDELRDRLLLLVEGRTPDAPIFLNDAGERATRYWAYYHVRRLVKDATGRDLSPQALRRTFADLGEDASVVAVAVAAHLGQTSPAVTERSYKDAEVTERARAGRVLKVLAGGAR
jgi:integrase